MQYKRKVPMVSYIQNQAASILLSFFFFPIGGENKGPYNKKVVWWVGVGHFYSLKDT